MSKLKHVVNVDFAVVFQDFKIYICTKSSIAGKIFYHCTKFFVMLLIRFT